jgi:hypothetical protein
MYVWVMHELFSRLFFLLISASAFTGISYLCPPIALGRSSPDKRRRAKGWGLFFIGNDILSLFQTHKTYPSDESVTG